MMYGDQNISKQTQQLVYALYQIYMITNISQYVLEHLTDQPEASLPTQESHRPL